MLASGCLPQLATQQSPPDVLPFNPTPTPPTPPVTLQPHPTHPPAAAKGKILGALAEADKNLVDGSDEFLQLLGAASYAQRVLMGLA